MARKERSSKGKVMKPNFFVFCEGDTEVAYTLMLRAYYRLPIHIIPKKPLLNLTPSLVNRCEADYVQTRNDRTYLMYDLDVESMLERLKKVTNATLLCSNPCFELWLLLHYEDIMARLTSDDCLSRLLATTRQYKKGIITNEMKKYLMENVTIATNRAKSLVAYQNPSTTVYQLIEDLKRLKSESNKAL